MKRHKKKELLETVAMLTQANDAIAEAVKTNPDGVAQILVSCQEAAIQIGSFLEEQNEKSGSLVKLLEDYCENIFLMSEAIADEAQCRKIAETIQKLLSRIQNGIECCLPDKKEVVFLPYKASMWDSLESVWKAADADENCDAYVVPIPYFTKNPDGSFREMHYEGDSYPDYVPVTSYEEYDFEARRPDEIYIHNGYDDCNIVTSVHPYFYSKNLKKFTDCLVYIPYFVLAEPDPENEDAIENIGHFCTISAVFHADRIIVQSEAMKQVYVKALMNATNDHSSAARKYWENKIEGTGSPKFDKLANTRREDVEIPTEWLHIINRPDGTPKKIVFYNNSIGALLQNNEKMIEKMKSVFEIFKENRDEIALLWRPHPLIESTLTSMRPQLWKAYKEIRDKYLAEGWGIYDDTADIDRAIVVSDAYYGDGSSVVEMYQKTGKPVMIQNVNVTAKEDKGEVYYGNPLLFEDCVLAERKIYFVGYHIAVLCSMDIDTGEIEYISRIPNTMIIQCRLITKILCYENKLFLLPGRLDDDFVWIFDLESKTWNALAFQNERIHYPYEKFSYATIYKNELFMVGCYYPGIVCINLINNKIQYYNIFPNNMAIHSLEDCIFEEEKIYIPDPNNNSVYIFDVNNKELQCIQIGNANNSYAGITKNGEKFWLSPFKSKSIVQWDGKTDIQEYELPHQYENMDGLIFKGITSFNDNVYCMGRKEKKSFQFSKNEYQKNMVLDTNYLIYKKLDTNKFLFGDYDGNISIMTGNEIKKYSVKIANDVFQSFVNTYKTQVKNKVNFVQEENFLGDINVFISLLK